MKEKPALLIIDDSSEFRSLIKSDGVMENFGAIYEASGSRDALRIIEEHPEIQCATVDVNMGPQSLDGYKLTEVLRRQRPDLRILILSDSIDLPRAKTSGADLARRKSLTLDGITEVLDGLAG